MSGVEREDKSMSEDHSRKIFDLYSLCGGNSVGSKRKGRRIGRDGRVRGMEAGEGEGKQEGGERQAKRKRVSKAGEAGIKSLLAVGCSRT